MKQTIKQGFEGGGGGEEDEVMKRRKGYKKQVIQASIDYLKEVKVLLNRKNKMIDRRNLEKYSGKRKESSPLKQGCQPKIFTIIDGITKKYIFL